MQDQLSLAAATSKVLPIGSIVVPFWDYLIIGLYKPQKGTTMEPMGKGVLVSQAPQAPVE